MVRSPRPVSTVRILIADDHPVFRDGLKRLLESEPGFTVVGECADGVEAIRLSRELDPEVLLLDLAMPRQGGLETLTALQMLPTRIVVLTAAIEPAELLRAVQLGARGVVLKEAAPRQIVEGIHRVMAGKYVIENDVADDLANAIRRASPQKPRSDLLTARELEIVSGLLGGQKNREVCRKTPN